MRDTPLEYVGTPKQHATRSSPEQRTWMLASTCTLPAVRPSGRAMPGCQPPLGLLFSRPLV